MSGTNNLRAFHGDPDIKRFYLDRLREPSVTADLISFYFKDKESWRSEECILHGGNHEWYEDAAGIPRSILALEDFLFDELPYNSALSFPQQFLEAIPVGSDLSAVTSSFLSWLLVDQEIGVILRVSEPGEKIIRQASILLGRDKIGSTSTKDVASLASEAAYAAYVAHAKAEAYTAAFNVASYAFAENNDSDCVADCVSDIVTAVANCIYAFNMSKKISAGMTNRGAAAIISRIEKEDHYILMAQKLLALLAEAPIPTTAGGATS